MIRWYLLLLLMCLLLQDRRKGGDPSDLAESTAVRVEQKRIILKDEDLLRQDLLAGLAFTTGQQFPGAIPWGPMHEIGAKRLYPVDALIHYHPLLFLEMCLEHYKAGVNGYTAKLIKRERLGGNLEPLEKIEIAFREHPFSVYMNWLEGGSGLMKPKKVLYVNGENKGKLLARGQGLAALVGVFEKDVDSDEAKSTGRYTLDQFGIYLGTERTVANMRKAQARGTLHLTYQGRYKKPELGDRVCYEFVRTPYEPPEEDGINELIIYIDEENWLQVGSVLKDAKGHLIAEYFFRDLKVNPEFKKDQFTRAAL